MTLKRNVGLNPTKIEWCDFSLSIITGCTFGCPYCYARRMAYRLKGRSGYDLMDPFRPTLHKDRLSPIHLTERFKSKNSRLAPGHAIIFLNSMGETFDPSADPSWAYLCLKFIEDHPQHQFILLTKQPARAGEILYTYDQEVGPTPDNLWLGISADRQDVMYTRLNDLYSLWSNGLIAHPLLSVEPIHECIDIPEPFEKMLQWIIVGCETGPHAHLNEPPMGSLDWFVWYEKHRGKGIPLFLKDNCSCIMSMNQIMLHRAFPMYSV